MTSMSVDKMKERQNFRNLWHSSLMNTIQDDAPYCCFALWCGPCVSYLLRKRALYNDMSRYVCCAGYLPCSGKCGERHCPEFCLCTEQVLLEKNNEKEYEESCEEEYEAIIHIQQELTKKSEI